MQNFCRPPAPRNPMLKSFPRLRLIALCAAAAIALTSAPAQTLAHPGWVGNGLSSAAWWQRAIFYRVSSTADPVDLKAITVRLDALRALGVDALLLPAPELPPPGSLQMPNLDAFDELLRQAGAHDIRVLLTLRPPSGTADFSGLARFWLNRGIAGLYVPTAAGVSPEAAQAQVQALKKLVSNSPGQRIILADSDLDPRPNAKAAPRHTNSDSQLQIDPRLNRLASLDAASLRPLLAQTIDQPNLLLDLRPPNSTSAHPQLAQISGVIGLLTHPVGLIDSAANLVLEPTVQETEIASQSEQPTRPAPKPLPPGTYEPYVPYVPPPRPRKPAATKSVPTDPLTIWYEKLTELHHANVVIRLGTKTFLDFDAQNALVWVNRPAKPSPTTPPVVVICNLSTSPVQLSLTEAIKKLNLTGWFLRTLLRSDDTMGGQNLDSVKVPAYGVYIGELRR
jgi:hypothetical protein